MLGQLKMPCAYDLGGRSSALTILLGRSRIQIGTSPVLQQKLRWLFAGIGAGCGSQRTCGGSIATRGSLRVVPRNRQWPKSFRALLENLDQEKALPLTPDPTKGLWSYIVQFR